MYLYPSFCRSRSNPLSLIFQFCRTILATVSLSSLIPLLSNHKSTTIPNSSYYFSLQHQKVFPGNTPAEKARTQIQRKFHIQATHNHHTILKSREETETKKQNTHSTNIKPGISTQTYYHSNHRCLDTKYKNTVTAKKTCLTVDPKYSNKAVFGKIQGILPNLFYEVSYLDTQTI